MSAASERLRALAEGEWWERSDPAFLLLLADALEALAAYRANHRDFVNGGCFCSKCHASDAILARAGSVVERGTA